jgi:hypothetical protein
VNKIETAHDVFWLARHAHNTLAPLITAAQQYEPSINLHIEMNFCDANSPFSKNNSIGVDSHWKRGGMFHQGIQITTQAQIARIAAKVQDFIDAEQAKLEEAEDVKAVQEWERQQERAAERADFEREDVAA